MGSVTTSHDMGLHQEKLAGRTQQRFFSPAEEENFTYPWSYEVDFDKSAEFDAADMEISAINLKIRELMKSGHGTITVSNPRAKHSLGVGILNRLNLNFEGSLGYFGCGLTDGANIHISGRVGWSCAENMMAGTVVIEKNAGSLFGAAIRGGDLVCRGQAGGRVGIDQKGPLMRGKNKNMTSISGTACSSMRPVSLRFCFRGRTSPDLLTASRPAVITHTLTSR